ncbi:MAG: SRPBCC family protein [Paracoccus sp. (in: a-proteobacteria)]
MTAETHREGIDLYLTRHYAASPDKLWAAWTDPAILVKWFAPDPVQVPEAVIEARPGGIFRVKMVLPDGTEMSDPGCILEVEKNHKLVFTDALDQGFRPLGAGFMTAIITFDPEDGGTRYRARVLHKDAGDCDRHEQMGFHEGWSAVAEQLAHIVEG